MPTDVAEGGDDVAAAARLVTVELGEEDTRALVQDVPRAYQTEINDVLLTALAQALSTWTGERAVLFDLEGHGREPLFDDVDLTRTVGWFTAIFPVRLELPASSPGDALRAAKEQLRKIPNRGVTFGVLRYLATDAGIVEPLRALPAPDVSFNYLGQLAAAKDLESSGRHCSPRARRRHAIDINAHISGGCLKAEWEFSEKRHVRATIQRVADEFRERLRLLIAHARSSRAEALVPSDFAQARISQRDLDKLVKVVAGGTKGAAP
jgi:non-ribosomal peptide synthase protein (TIGR01720 family)